jgi:hypothetical protein
MGIIERLKRLATKEINGDQPTRHIERALVVRWGKTATIKRTPVRGREKGKSE